MIRVQARTEPSTLMTFASPFLAIVLTLIFGSILFTALDKDPIQALHVLLVLPLSDAYGAFTALCRGSIAVLPREYVEHRCRGSITRRRTRWQRRCSDVCRLRVIHGNAIDPTRGHPIGDGLGCDSNVFKSKI